MAQKTIFNSIKYIVIFFIVADWRDLQKVKQKRLNFKFLEIMKIFFRTEKYLFPPQFLEILAFFNPPPENFQQQGNAQCLFSGKLISTDFLCCTQKIFNWIWLAKDKRQKKRNGKSSQLIFNEEISCRVEGNIMFHAMLKLFAVYYVYEFMYRKEGWKIL